MEIAALCLVLGWAPVKQEKFGGLRLAGVPERQSKAFDFFVSRERFLVSAFAFEQFKLLVK